MSIQTPPSELIARRAELMAELFFQDFNPHFLWRPTSPDLGYDLLVGFQNSKEGINTFAVEVVPTEEPIVESIKIARSKFDRLANSNVPSVLIVADVKGNQLYYAWLRTTKPSSGGKSVNVTLTKVDESARKELRRQFVSPNHAEMAVAG